MKKLLLFSLLSFCYLQVSILYAQQRFTGIVRGAEDKEPLPGVSVKVKGTNNGVQTDAEGKFSISTSSGQNTLVFTFIGYITQEVNAAGKSMMRVSLKSANTELSEVVVVGYGTQERRDITGSVGTIKGENIKNLAAPSIDKQLAGQVTGVQASTNSGILGTPARIRIRGTNSISNSADPLYVVDGVPYISGDRGSVTQYNPLGDINPNDIESMEVLKDGSATAIYGSRAASGVILITTKKGKIGKARVTYDAWFASAKASKTFDLLNADEFITIANEKTRNIGEENDFAFPTPNPAGGFYNTNWQDVILKTAFQQNHALSLSGANDQTNYFFSAGYTDLQGTTIKNSLRKYSARAKIEQKALNNRVTFGMNTGLTYSRNNGLNDGANSNALSGNIAAAIRSLPNVPVKNADGTYNLSADQTVLGPGANLLGIDDNYPNIAYVLANNIYRSQALNLTGNAFAKVKIIDGMNATSLIGINYINEEGYQYWNPIHGDGRGSAGIVTQIFQPFFRYNWQNTLDYIKTFDAHKINIVAGIEFQKERDRSITAQGTNLSNVYFAENGNIISNTLANQFYGGGASEKAYQSYFARANYSLYDRYLLTATIRQDKISSLPIGNQDATLPGVSLGWRLSKESFFTNSKALSFINDLKIRGGYASVGNVEIGDYPYAGIFGPQQYGDFSGVGYSRLGNPNLKFETSKKINVGLDLTLFKNRITLTADYFKNDIDNLILSAPTPSSLGVPENSISTNIGQMNNKGWEFALSTINIQSKNFSWSSNLNLTFVKNKVTQLANNNADLVGTYNVTRVGQSIGTFYGYQSAGVNPANGNPLWIKANGSTVQADIATYNYYNYDINNQNDLSTDNLAEALTLADKRILGQSNPTWYGGFVNTLTYKQFDLGVFLTFSGGNKIYNVTRQEGLNNQKFINNGTEILRRWTTPGQNTDVPKVSYGDDNLILQNGNLNSRFLEDGKFLRAQNIALGYTIKPEILNKAGMNSLRIYVQAQNAFVITNYSGLDPELAGSATTNLSPGVDYNTNPIPRTFTFGLNLGF